MNKADKQIGYWLLIGAFLVVAMVVLGGYTRLSHSGLSMVTWKPVTGVVPPLNQVQWEEEFTKYKTSPEYQKRNYNFTVEEFKTIYWPEFSHRLLGRIIGMVFLIPFLYFLFSGKLKNKKLLLNLIVIFLLGGLQGFVGWYMVKSGLVDIPSVSHYRLAIHFIMALTLFVYILWTALYVLYPKKENTKSNTIRKSLNILLGFVVIQLIYGAFVAGLKAGMFYPTFPKMGSEWLPKSIGMAFDTYGLKGFTEFPALVQFIHRWMAAIIVALVGWIFYKGKKSDLSVVQSQSLLAMLIVVLIQFLLGVFTLLYLVPISLGVLHQLGSVALLTTIIVAMYNFRKVALVIEPS
ncbi:MAG: COX15/CtaA family protein [Cyclobacteriaceae bacterium]|nr:COX15/CtaA family protein [Cyclobacteriaceae bacterium]